MSSAEPAIVVLVVDDEELILDIIEDALETGGFATLRARNGREAVAALDSAIDKIRAVVTDIRVGEGPDGWEVARHGRELNSHLPVVYMSGDSLADWNSKGVPGSVPVQKPFAPAQIVTAVASLINQTSD